MSTSATQFATQELPFNFDNLFPHLIIHPNETIKGEEWKAWLTSVVLGIFTLGTLQLGCWIHEQYLQKKIEEKKQKID
jgi:hypothetical protein